MVRRRSAVPLVDEIAVLGAAVAWQNAQMLHYVLARYAIPFIEP